MNNILDTTIVADATLWPTLRDDPDVRTQPTDDPKSAMDEAEAHIHKYLAHRGFVDIKHEPDGNVPPDFLVNDRIAVEVRRLIQHEDSAGRPRGLSENANSAHPAPSIASEIARATKQGNIVVCVRQVHAPSRGLEDARAENPSVA
jgi:hypothetical protein